MPGEARRGEAMRGEASTVIGKGKGKVYLKHITVCNPIIISLRQNFTFDVYSANKND